MTNVGRVQRKKKSAKATSLAFLLLDFQQERIQKKSVLYETECRLAAFQLGKQDQNH